MVATRLTLTLVLLLTLGCSSPTESADVSTDAGGHVDVLDVSTSDIAPDAPSDVPVGDVAPAGPYSGFVPSGAYIQDMLGVSTHMSRSVDYSWKREAELDLLEELGFTRVRSDFYWKEIEREEGVYNIAGQAHLTDLCLERGFSLLGILLIPPEWAKEDGSTDNVDQEKFRAYVRYTVSEMGDRVNSWEIWNEQNIHVFWPPAPNPEIFGEFLKVAAEEIRDVHPNAEVVFGGLSPFEFHTENIWGFMLDVAEFHPDICDYFDALAIHPYTAFQQEAPETTYEMGRYTHPPMGGLIGEARYVLEQAGCGDRPIHLTEAGWPDYYMGVENQGAFAARGLLLAAAAGASTYYWYTFWDSFLDGTETVPTEDTFGLMTWPASEEEPGERKPSFHAMKGISTLLRGSRYAGDLGQKLGWEENLHGLAFLDDEGLFTVAVWHSIDSHEDEPKLDEEIAVEIPLPEGATAWTRYDQTAAEVDAGTDGPIALDATGRVTYLQFR